MPRRALVENRPWLLASLVAAIAFYALSDGHIGGLFLLAFKGGACLALAAYALSRVRSGDGPIIALVMILGAAGDVAMELDTGVGGLLFLLGHFVAIWLYLRNRRTHLSGSQRMAAAALLLLVPLLAWLLSADPLVAVYALGLGGMAAAAWTSRFSRYNVGVGALLFVASDLLIFARLGEKLDPSVTGWLVWPLYYVGQLLIATGVIRTLRRDHEA
jgi:uncharacterized membrane protein YhhN